MKALAFDGIARELGEVSTRRSMVRLFAGAAAAGAGLGLVTGDQSQARAKHQGKAQAHGKSTGKGSVTAQGKKKSTITICYQTQTRTVKKKGSQTTYPGATPGPCPTGGIPQGVCTSWIVSGGPDRTTPISVDDDLRMMVNGVNVINDVDGKAGNIPPVAFAANVGDSLGVIANDVGVSCRSLSPLWLHCATSAQKKQLSAGNADGCAPGRTAGTFFSEVFTIAL